VQVPGNHCFTAFFAQFDYCAFECTKQTKFAEIEAFCIIASMFRFCV
jgi:hypothetical protein